MKAHGACAGLLVAALSPSPALAADFAVRTPGAQFAFQINGVDSPTLTLVRGRTYVFDVQTSVGFHPFHIYSAGVDTNDIDTGIIHYKVPTNAANYFYDCSSHHGAMFGSILTVPPADFVVRTPGDQFAFQINGTNSPTLTLMRGQTYVFDVQTSPGLHPFHLDSPGANLNDIDSGRITYTVPTANANYFYDCLEHWGFMRGQILTIPRPTFRILNLQAGSNIVLRSTGTNTWSVSPEFTTNLSATNWFALTVQTNRLRDGTNEVICGRPPGPNMFIRLRAQEIVP